MRFRLAASQVKFTPCVLAAIISVICAANAKASPITYTESSTVSGTLNSVSFTNELLTLTGTGDTASVTNPISGLFSNPVGTVSFTLGAVSGTFTDAFDVSSCSACGVPGLAGFFDLGVNDLLNTLSAAFATYALSIPIGPVTGSSFINAGLSFPTSVGALVINSAGDATFTAVVTPLPTALPLFASGLVGLLLLGWRRKKAT